MISLVTGKQRSGKSFYVMMLIVYYLRFTRMTICTNLPIYPDKLAYYASLGMKGKNAVLYSEYLNRFRLFANHRDRQDIKKFIKHSPDFWMKKEKGKVHPLMFTTPQLLEFWNHTPSNSVIFIDEVYQFFSSMDFQDISKRRKELLAYTRQHGHYKDDLFLISHNMADIDIHVRRGIQYKYEVVNMKYKNLIPAETRFIGTFFRGLKCPIQYFAISGYEFGEDVASDYFTIFPDNRLFKCYDSHSKAETLNKQLSPDSYTDESSDVGVNFWFNFKRFLIQFFPQLLMIMGFIIGIYFAYVQYKKFTSSPVTMETDSKGKKEIPKIVFKMKDKIKYSDGVIIKKGGDYGMFKIIDIDSKYITVEFTNKIGKLEKSRVEISGFRK